MDLPLAEIIDKIPAIVDLYDVESDRILWANSGFQEITGYTVSEANRIGALMLVLPDDRDTVLNKMMRLAPLASNTVQSIDYRIITKRRQVRWISSYKSLWVADGKYFVLGISLDVTHQRDEEHQAITEIRTALSNDEFRLYFQPIVHLASNTIAGAEVLTRWHRKDGSIAKPGSFMPSIEKEPGTSKRFCLYVLSRVGIVLDRYPTLFITVNVSPILLEQPGFLEFIVGLVNPKQANRLIIEITETLSVERIDYLASLIQDLRNYGVMTVLDDFGTGHNSLRNLIYLRSIAKVKIDQQFIQNLNDPRIFSIVRSITGLCHDLEIQAVAEGIETEEQAITARRLGCDFGQGYFFGKPALLL